jgi:hypothetical protein
MKCDEFKSDFYEFHDEMLDADLAEEMRAHINECKECSRINVRYENFLDKFSNLPDTIEPENDLWEGIKKRIPVRNGHLIKRIRFLSIAASFIAVTLFSAIMFYYGRNNNDEAKTMKQFNVASK